MKLGLLKPVINTIRDDTNCCIAVVGEVDHHDSEKFEAAANLMAAAPKLLWGLKQATDNIEAWCDLHPQDQDAGDMAIVTYCRSLINELEGQNPHDAGILRVKTNEEDE